MSSPDNAEDNLLEGYGSTYWSTKEKSLTIELHTLGSLQDVFNASIKGKGILLYVNNDYNPANMAVSAGRRFWHGVCQQGRVAAVDT